MLTRFAKNISPYVNVELGEARVQRNKGQVDIEFEHLENAHVLGQESSFHHVKVHLLMLLWGVRNRSLKEIMGQIFRIIGAATKTVFGLVPQGNTGGSNVSPFKTMPISKDYLQIIHKAKL